MFNFILGLIFGFLASFTVLPIIKNIYHTKKIKKKWDKKNDNSKNKNTL